ncbi:MAG: SDR family oxidoreductase, partial [Mangrovimonas sp.]|nr:SDR family oxidoreductase [Mangrovimonas sp.]
TITNTDLANKLLRNDKMIDLMKDKHPLKKILNPEEVGNLAVYLLSEKSSGITGQIMTIDCGLVSLKI